MLPFFQQNRPFRSFVARDLVYPLHLHSNLECVYIYEGKLHIQISEETHTLYAGDFALILPGIVHSYRESAEDTCLLQCVLFAPSFCGASAQALWSASLREPILRQEAVHANIPYALQTLQEEEADATVRAALLQLILARSLPLLVKSNEKTTKSERLLPQILQYVGEHFREPLTLTTLAETLHISPYHLSHVFSERIGMSFPRYITEFRLDCAATLIRQSDRSLTEIWLESGFESQRTFNRAFRRVYGMTPSEYRAEK